MNERTIGWCFRELGPLIGRQNPVAQALGKSWIETSGSVRNISERVYTVFRPPVEQGRGAAAACYVVTVLGSGYDFSISE